MSEQPDPERLLAEALRAQAVRAPRVDPASHPNLPPVPRPATQDDVRDPGPPSGPTTGPTAREENRVPYGVSPLLPLLSGTDGEYERYDLYGGRAADTLGLPPVGPRPPGEQYVAAARAPRRRSQLSAPSIVLLAVLLGLVAGAVVGLISLL